MEIKLAWTQCSKSGGIAQTFHRRVVFLPRDPEGKSVCQIHLRQEHRDRWHGEAGGQLVRNRIGSGGRRRRGKTYTTAHITGVKTILSLGSAALRFSFQPELYIQFHHVTPPHRQEGIANNMCAAIAACS